MVALLAGCGAAPGSYAGLSATGARAQAMAGLAANVRRPGSGLYRHRIRFVSVARSHYPSGDKAWLVRARDLTVRQNVCVWVSSRALANEAYTRPCGPVSAPRAPGPGTTSLPPA